MIQSVRKACELLTMLLFDDPEQRGLTLTTLAQKLGTPRNTAHTLLQTLVACGYAAQTTDARYLAGPRCREVGLLNQLTAPLANRAIQALLEHASATLQESLAMTTLLSGRCLLVAGVEIARPVRIDHAVLHEKNLFALATGRVLAAFASAEAWEEIRTLHGDPAEHWPEAGDAAALADMCAQIRANGLHVLTNTEEGLLSIACPIVNACGGLIGAVGCYAPAFRCDAEMQQTIITTIRQTADAICRQF